MSDHHIGEALDRVLKPAGVLNCEVRFEYLRSWNKGSPKLLGVWVELVMADAKKLPPPQDYEQWLSAVQDRCEEAVQSGADRIWVKVLAGKLTQMDEDGKPAYPRTWSGIKHYGRPRFAPHAF